MLLTRTQKLRWAAAKNNSQMPREGLTCISNPSSHTIFVIGQQVAQWHFYVLFSSPPTLISASNLTFCLPQMAIGKPTGLPHRLRPTPTHSDGQKFSGLQDTFLCLFYYCPKMQRRELKGLRGPLYTKRPHGFMQHYGLQRMNLAKYVSVLRTAYSVTQPH